MGTVTRAGRFLSLIGMLAVLAFIPPARGEADVTAEKPWRVVFAQDTLANDWRRAQALGLEREFRHHPRVKFRFTDAKGNTAQQIQDIEDALAEGLDLLIVSPRDAELMAPVVAKAKRQGVRVVLLSRRVNGDAYDTFIRADNFDIGRRAAKRLGQRLKGRGAILVLQGVPPASTTIERTDGFLAGLKEFPSIQVAAIRPADFLRDKAVSVMEDVLARGIRFDAVYSQSDSMAVGVRAALKRAGIDPKTVPIVGVDYIAEAREAIRNGEQEASFVYPTFVPEGVEATIRLLSGRPVPREIIAGSQMVTRDNVEKIEPIF